MQNVLRVVKQPDSGSLPPSALRILEILATANDELDSSQIIARCDYSKRQCYYSLKKLLKSGYIKKEPCLYDARKSLYKITAKIEAAKAAVSGLQLK